MTRERQLRVGFDVDGVLRNVGLQFFKYVQQTYGIRPKPGDMDQWGFPNVVDASGRKIIQDVFANPSVGKMVFENAPTLANAYTGYRMFIDHPRIDTYIVSDHRKDYQGFTDYWLETHRFTGHIKTFYERNKLKAPIQVLIDDKPANIEKFVKNQRDGILINQTYNQNISSEVSFSRADDLVDAYRMLIKKYSSYL